MKNFYLILIGITLTVILVSCAMNATEIINDSVNEQPKEAAEELVLPDDFWQYVDGSTATIPISEALYDRFQGEGKIIHNRTYNAYTNLLEGKAQLIFALEPPADILPMFEEANVEIEIIPIVKDAFIMFVNSQNPVESLTISQLRDIYTGNTINWKDVGGEDLFVIPYQRNDDAGSQALFLMFLMQDVKPLFPPDDYIKQSMKDIIDAVAIEDRGRAAIGFNVFYYANVMYANDNIRLLAVEGVAPSQESIISGEYPFSSYYYAVIRKDTPQDHPSRRLIDFILSDEGQLLMEKSGYVPIRVLD